jgi:hypothetical protein
MGGSLPPNPLPPPRRPASHAGALHLEPSGQAGGPIGRVHPLRHEAFRSHPAGPVELGLTVIVFHMLVETYARGGLSQDRRQGPIADREWIAQQSSRSGRSDRRHRGTRSRRSGDIQCDRTPRCRARRRRPPPTQPRQDFDDQRKVVLKIVPWPAVKPHSARRPCRRRRGTHRA